MTVFACNPDESAGFSEKVCRYVVYECWTTSEIAQVKPTIPAGMHLMNPQQVCVEIAECDTKEAIGTMLVQLADDRAEIDSPPKVMALYDRLESRWITGTP